MGMRLYQYLNSHNVQIRSASNDPYLVKVKCDNDDQIMSESMYGDPILYIHLLPCSNFKETIIIENCDTNECAKWEGPFFDDGEWVEAPPIDKGKS